MDKINEGKWEAVADAESPEDAENGRFWRVRWSVEFKDKGFFYIRHYGGNGDLNEVMAKNNANSLNEEGRSPYEFM